VCFPKERGQFPAPPITVADFDDVIRFFTKGFPFEDVTSNSHSQCKNEEKWVYCERVSVNAQNHVVVGNKNG
jgi:hypothetical protein